MPSRSPSEPEQVTDLGPRILLVASISDRVRQPNLDLTLQAGKQVHRDRGVTEPVQPAKRAQRGHGFIENGLAELVGTRADVVSTVRCCHSRIMPDTTAAVTRPVVSTPKRRLTGAEPGSVLTAFSDDTGSSTTHPRLHATGSPGPKFMKTVGPKHLTTLTARKFGDLAHT